MIEIQSVQNPRVKAAVKLRSARGRQQQGRILIEGARELRCALQAGVRVHEVFFDDAALQHPDAQQAWKRLDSATEQLRVVSAVWEKLSVRGHDAQLVATASPPDVGLRRLTFEETPLLLVLDSIEKPGNLGALFRTADAVGVDVVLISDPVCDVFNPNAIRASLGAVFTLPCGVGTAADIQALIREHNIHAVAARIDGKVDYWDVDLRQSTAIVMGSEAKGLSDAWQCDAVRLPMCGRVDSLNVSVAAAALLYEAVRQRREPPETT